MPGEICIAGESVAQGYINNSEKTTQSFIDNPFGEGKLYKTGDQGRLTHDGHLEFMGRLEEQVDYTCKSNVIGKIHAEITKRDGQYYIKDLNSRNGTFVNSERIDSNKEYEIKHNDRVSLANCEYTFIVPS